MALDDDRKVFVGGLTDTATEVMLRGLFVDAGVKVVDISVPRDRMTGRARGFGFVTLATSADADNAVNQLDGKPCDGRAISVRPFQSKGAAPAARPPISHGPPASVYVANLPFDVSEAEVIEAFSTRGIRVAEVRIPRERGAGRGYGFVNLESADDVAKAVAKVDGAELKGRPMVVKTVRPRGAPSDAPPSTSSNARFDAGPPSARPDLDRRRPVPAPSMAPPPNPDWGGDAEAPDRRHAQKPKKKEAKVKATGRPRSTKERTRAGADWSRRYDSWDDD